MFNKVDNILPRMIKKEEEKREKEGKKKKECLEWKRAHQTEIFKNL